jgi:O-antigen ligase
MLTIPVALRELVVMPEIPVFIYYIFYLIPALAAICKKDFKLNTPTLLLLVLCAISIAINDIPIQFQPLKRFITFLILIVAVGPLIQREWLTNARLCAINTIGWCLVVETAISFILYYIAKDQVMAISSKGPLFRGIFVQSMTTGGVAALSAIFLLNRIFTELKPKISAKKIIEILLFIICIFTCILTGSRIALIGLIISIIVYLWQQLKNKKRFFIAIIAIVAAVIITMPIWQQYTASLSYKNEYAKEHNSMIASREDSWNNRLLEIKEKPLTGVGFAYTKYYNTRFNNANNIDKRISQGLIEPGSGWLFILSSVGPLALLIFTFLYLLILIQLIRISDNRSNYLSSVLILFGIRMIAEGFMFASGSLFCLIFWLTMGASLGYIYQVKSTKKLSIFSKSAFCINIHRINILHKHSHKGDK